MTSIALLRAAEARLAENAELAVLDLCLVVRSDFPDIVHGALKLLSPLFLDCGDNALRQNIVASLKHVDALGFTPSEGLLAGMVRVVSDDETLNDACAAAAMQFFFFSRLGVLLSWTATTRWRVG